MVRCVCLRPGAVSLWTRFLPGRCLLGALLASVCLLLLASRLPFSPLYLPVHDAQMLELRVRRDNHLHSQHALHYFLNSQKRSDSELKRGFMQADGPLDFVVTIITVRRNSAKASNYSLGYLLQSAAAMDHVVRTSPVFSRSLLFVCNVDRYPSNHGDALFLKDYLPYVEMYGTSVLPATFSLTVPGTDKLYSSLKHAFTSSIDRERSDYTFCLQAARLLPAKYYLVLQDDAIPHPDMPGVLQHSLSKLTKHQRCRHSSQPTLLSSSSCTADYPPYTSDLSVQTRKIIHPSPNASFAYLKLFFPERWQGFAFELDRVLDLISISAVFGSIGVMLWAAVGYCKAQAASIKVSCYIGWTLFLVLGVYAIGRQNLNEMRRASKYLYRLQSSPDCCIPAMLYPAPVMPFLVTWLAESPPSVNVDKRVSAWSKHYDLPAYSLEPNVFQHIGMVSSLPATRFDKKPVEEFVHE